MVNHVIRYGDLVTVYIDHKRKYTIRIRKGGILGTDKGFMRHDDIVGKRYGEYISTSRGFKAYLLRPLLIDYLNSIHRVTQIVYPKDASFIIYLSSIKPGSIILEAGVGSGFLTLSILNFIGSSGKLIGFDIRDEHIRVARENIEKHGFSGRVQLILGDIRDPDLVGEGVFDAVFYDLPDPWNALNTAYKGLKPSSPILVYLPTINQVEKTVLAMRSHGGFTDIHVYEIMVREYSVEEGATRPYTLMIGHTGYIVFARKIIM